ncbi:hypothetical protein Ahy_B06g084158 isoform B [Arachis hypogaea]|uniref:Uncharacterized protein n=1 Tax=Arachis hypogaea TaxID=3818 RepID=A0A444YR41_ARAHY|nr:hypothetical protein Ahy_B06g084158 isoform B [Arachis hypogaea]
MPGEPRKIKDREIELPYIDISGQKTPYKSFTLKIVYDCAVYVMKWLEIIEPQNVKKEKYELDNWTQESEAMRLSNPSADLLSPYCQVDSYDIDSDND